MKTRFSDIELAFEFVSTGTYGGNSALLDKDTGKIYYESELGESDEIPEELYGSDNAVEIPHQNDLDLGSRLIFRFVRDTFPNGYNKVREIFSSRGAYARYKVWLKNNGLLEKWYTYENDARDNALREWCADNKVELEKE